MSNQANIAGSRNTLGWLWIALVVAFIASVLLWFGYSLVDTIPAGAQTHSAGIRLSRRVLEYARAHGSPPSSLAVLEQADPQSRQWLKDEWGRPFQYTVETGGSVTLVSLGSDAKPGGEHANADRIWRVELKNAAGAWLNPDSDADVELWLKNFPSPKY